MSSMCQKFSFYFGLGECTVRLGAYAFHACLLFWRCDDTISHVRVCSWESGRPSKRVREGECTGMREHVNETDGKLSSQPPLHTNIHSLRALYRELYREQQVILWNGTFCVGQMYWESNLFFYICPVVCHCVWVRACVCRCLFAHNFVVAVVVVSLSLIIVELSHSHISFWFHLIHWRESFYLFSAYETKQYHFLFALKLFRWHSTARSFIWSHALTVSPGLKHLLISLFRLSLTSNVQIQTEKKQRAAYLQARAALPHTPKENKRSVLVKAGIKLNAAAVFWDCGFSSLFNRYVVYFDFLCFSNLEWSVCRLEAAIQFRKTSMKLLTAPFIYLNMSS